MKILPLKRRITTTRVLSAAFFFVTGFLIALLATRKSISSVGSITLATSILHAWRHSPETCREWISVQRESRSYIDAYVAGSQKGATSQMSKHLYELGVRHENMVKEWHFYNSLDEHGQIVEARTVARPLPPLNLSDLRLAHYHKGFPDANETVLAVEQIPLVDDSPIESRRLTMDMTVEYLHSDRSAFLAHALTPHAKVIITIRDPLERALSQYNMNVRNGNRNRRKLGKEDSPATPEEFHKKVEMEIKKLSSCGYDSLAGTLDRKTSQLAACLFNNSKEEKFDDTMYVARGLYHIHLQTWRAHFPTHRIMVVSFQHMSMGKRQLYHDLSQFLCVRPYPEDLLKSFEDEGSSLSFGQQAAKHGLESAGFDTYTGNDRYLPDMWHKTRVLLRSFYESADKHLTHLLGREYVYWSI